MGVVNLTPDSFSDGGRFAHIDEALAVAEQMATDGASVIDVGGESTRPGAAPVTVEEELGRVLPFVSEAARGLPVPVSVDTRKARVAREALAAGAKVVNDVSGLRHDPETAGVVAEHGAGVVIMHMRGDPSTMAERACYSDVSAEVANELERAVRGARAAGIDVASIVVDPGVGFAKDADHSLELLGRLRPVVRLGFPVLVGPSRKSFLGAVLGVPPDQRLAGTIAACMTSFLQGASIFRVHDVKPVVEALAVAAAITGANGGPAGAGA